MAARDNGFTAKAGRKIVLAAAERYRTAMREFAAQTFLDVWYAHLDSRAGHRRIQVPGQGQEVQGSREAAGQAHTADSTKALAKLTTMVDGHGGSSATRR